MSLVSDLMLDKLLDWKKNVKRIKYSKVISKIDYKVNTKSLVNREMFLLQKEILNRNPLFYHQKEMKLRIEKYKCFISDKLDLHGYSIGGAYSQLMDFIFKNYQAGNRYLLVITGYSTSDKEETIKNSLSKWLNINKIRHMILCYQQATKKHGGRGAFYIFLRRNKG